MASGFAQRATQTALIYGVGADDLDAVKRQPLVTSIVGLDETLQPVPTSLRVAGPLVAGRQRGRHLGARRGAVQRHLEQAARRRVGQKGRDEVPDAVVAEKNYKYAVQLRGPLSRPLPAIPGMRCRSSRGKIPEMLDQPLTLKVLFNGKPAAGVKVLRDYVTDPDAKPLLTRS